MYYILFQTLSDYIPSYLGRTTIVIAHQLKTIENAHRIYVFDKGSIVEHGTHQSLINKAFGTYKNMVDIQSIARVTDNASEIPDEVYYKKEYLTDLHTFYLDIF